MHALYAVVAVLAGPVVWVAIANKRIDNSKWMFTVVIVIVLLTAGGAFVLHARMHDLLPYSYAQIAMILSAVEIFAAIMLFMPHRKKATQRSSRR